MTKEVAISELSRKIEAATTELARLERRMGRCSREMTRLFGELAVKEDEYYRLYKPHPRWSKTIDRKEELYAILDEAEFWRRREYELREERDNVKQRQTELVAKMEKQQQIKRAAELGALMRKLQADYQKSLEAKVKQQHKERETEELLANDEYLWAVRDLFAAKPFNNGYEQFLEGMELLFEEGLSEMIAKLEHQIVVATKVFGEMPARVSEHYWVLAPDTESLSAQMVFNKMAGHKLMDQDEVTLTLIDLSFDHQVKLMHGMVEWPTGIGIITSRPKLFWWWRRGDWNAYMGSINPTIVLGICYSGMGNCCEDYLSTGCWGIRRSKKGLDIDCLDVQNMNSEEEIKEHGDVVVSGLANLNREVGMGVTRSGYSETVVVFFQLIVCYIILGKWMIGGGTEMGKINYTLSMNFMILGRRVPPDKCKRIENIMSSRSVQYLGIINVTGFAGQVYETMGSNGRRLRFPTIWRYAIEALQDKGTAEEHKQDEEVSPTVIIHRMDMKKEGRNTVRWVAIMHRVNYFSKILKLCNLFEEDDTVVNIFGSYLDVSAQIVMQGLVLSALNRRNQFAIALSGFFELPNALYCNGVVIFDYASSCASKGAQKTSELIWVAGSMQMHSGCQRNAECAKGSIYPENEVGLQSLCTHSHVLAPLVGFQVI